MRFKVPFHFSPNTHSDISWYLKSGFAVKHYRHPVCVRISRFMYLSRKPRNVTTSASALRSSRKMSLSFVRFSIKSERVDKILVKIANIKFCGNLSDGIRECLSGQTDEYGDPNSCCCSCLGLLWTSLNKLNCHVKTQFVLQGNLS